MLPPGIYSECVCTNVWSGSKQGKYEPKVQEIGLKNRIYNILGSFQLRKVMFGIQYFFISHQAVRKEWSVDSGQISCFLMM